MQEFLKNAKNASRIIASLEPKNKDKILKEMADTLLKNSQKIITENQKDLDDAFKELTKRKD